MTFARRRASRAALKIAIAYFQTGWGREDIFAWGVPMETVPRSWASRLIRNPVAIIGAIGSVFVMLANAEPAMNGATHIWHRWTQPPPRLETTWQGTWKSRDGFNYALAMQLEVAESGDADGEISWELVAT